MAGRGQGGMHIPLRLIPNPFTRQDYNERIGVHTVSHAKHGILIFLRRYIEDFWEYPGDPFLFTSQQIDKILKDKYIEKVTNRFKDIITHDALFTYLRKIQRQLCINITMFRKLCHHINTYKKKQQVGNELRAIPNLGVNYFAAQNRFERNRQRMFPVAGRKPPRGKRKY